MNKKVITGLALLLLATLVWFYFDEEKPIPVRLVSVSKGTVDLTVSNTRAGTIKPAIDHVYHYRLVARLQSFLSPKGTTLKKIRC